MGTYRHRDAMSEPRSSISLFIAIFSTKDSKFGGMGFLFITFPPMRSPFEKALEVIANEARVDDGRNDRTCINISGGKSNISNRQPGWSSSSFLADRFISLDLLLFLREPQSGGTLLFVSPLAISSASKFIRWRLCKICNYCCLPNNSNLPPPKSWELGRLISLYRIYVIPSS